ncbi:MAG: orc1/cdc6 family replication initiation protein [Thaumarchaeota archaeon]|nr:orc1/cdc6 family replication initiation protein [Nitrososphaerota archaeon]
MSQKSTQHQPKKILADTKYLEPLSDPPSGKPIGREVELGFISEVASGKWKRNLIIFGPPGCGKTFCVKYTFKHSVDENVRCVYVNAGKTRTPYYTLSEILRDLGVNVPFSGWQMARLKQEFEWATRELHVVVAIDEAEVVLNSDDESIAYWFTRQPNVNLILIINDVSGIKMLPKRVKSTLAAFPIMFRNYSKDVAKSILKERFDKALAKDSFDEKWLDGFAGATSRLGDLRTSFQVTLTAAKMAEAKSQDKINDDDFEVAVKTFDALS